MRRRLPLVILGAYAAIVVGIIVIANLGGTEHVFGFVRWVPYGDKVGHFVLLGTLALLADLAAKRRGVGRLRVPLGPAIIAALVVLEELSQLALPTRSFDLADLAADAAGIVAFVALGRRLAPSGEAPARTSVEGAPDERA